MKNARSRGVDRRKQTPTTHIENFCDGERPSLRCHDFVSKWDLQPVVECPRDYDKLKKELDEAKLAAGLALTGREQAEERLEEYRGRVVDLENEVDRLTDELEASENDFREAQENANQYREETRELKAQIKDLEDRLKYERQRAIQALEVADNASMGIGAMSRTMHTVADLVERFERKLDR
jgi:chromosome segregation ATPase